MLHTIVKIVVSLILILAATAVGKARPSLAGLVGTMPLTALLIMIWLHLETAGDVATMRTYATGAFFGIFPSLLFFAVAVSCYRKNLPLACVLALSFAAWLTGALVHQHLLGGNGGKGERGQNISHEDRRVASAADSSWLSSSSSNEQDQR